MGPVTIKETATIQDLLNTPKDGRKYELVDGEILVTPAGMLHSKVASTINALIWNFLQENAIGEVYSSDVGILLPNGNVRSPDVTFVKHDKLPNGRSPESFGEVIPDLAVEVLSPGDSLKELGRRSVNFWKTGYPSSGSWTPFDRPSRFTVLCQTQNNSE